MIGSSTASEAAAPILNAPLQNIEWIQSLELGYATDAATTASKSNAAVAGVENVCFHCGDALSTDKRLTCARCQVASYCTKECQVKDWKHGGHKLACDSYKRAGRSMRLQKDVDKAEARKEIFGRIRFYACPYGVFQSRRLGKGFLFLQSNSTLAIISLALPKESTGRPTPSRSLLVHFLTLGEFDSEVCRDDFELASVRTKLQEAVQEYDEQKQMVVLMRFRCGHIALGTAPLVPDYELCAKLGQEYYSKLPGDARALQLDLDDV